MTQDEETLRALLEACDRCVSRCLQDEDPAGAFRRNGLERTAALLEGQESDAA